MSHHHFLFLGTPDFALPTLEMLIKDFQNTKLSVISMPDKKRGRGKSTSPSPIKQKALENNLDVYTPDSKSNLTDTIRSINPDLIIVIAYGMIIEKTIVDRFFCINIHASILPKYRGASPIQASLLNGDSRTGISIIKLNEKMDAGDFLMTEEIDIEVHDNHGVLSQKLAFLGANTCKNFILNQFLKNNFNPMVQDHSQATYCKKIQKEDLLITNDMSVYEIYYKIKAFSPKPGAYCMKDNKRIKLLAASIDEDQLTLILVQPEGKAPMPYSDFILGYPEGVGIHGN